MCTLAPEEVTFAVPDVKRNGFCFTDGVGFISPELARLAAETFHFSQSSAF